jgi:hypothetical protein
MVEASCCSDEESKEGYTIAHVVRGFITCKPTFHQKLESPGARAKTVRGRTGHDIYNTWKTLRKAYIILVGNLGGKDHLGNWV